MFDVLIIGGGPAGISAGIYAKRANLRVGIIERAVPGGQLSSIGEIENYPGFKSISGNDLSMNFYNHAESLGIEFIFDEAIDFNLNGDVKEAICQNKTYKAKTIIFALGNQPRKLGVPGEKELYGKGISYCAQCDGNFFKNKNVAIIGAGDASVSNALYLSNICKKVDILTRHGLHAGNYPEDVFKGKKNVRVHENCVVKEILGKDSVTGILYTQNEKDKKAKLDGVFVSVGRVTDTKYLKEKIELDSAGYIITTNEVETSEKGVYACGDIVSKSLKQIVVAASSGAKAATKALDYLGVH